MKSITFRANERLIERARLIARKRHKSLNSLFNDWLKSLAAESARPFDVDGFFHKTDIKVTGRYSREEMNER